MKQVPPLPGEETLYAWNNSLLNAAANDPEIKKTLKETAAQVESEMITPFLQWRLNGRAAGNGWNSPVNNAEWGTDYLNRTGTAKSNMYDNRPKETKYIYTDDDSQGEQLNGQNTYMVTFAKGEVPPVHGFWSLTLYDAEHFFHPNELKRYSLGTKNKTLKYNGDGSLTLYAGSKSPGKDKESNWLPAPNGPFSLYFAPIGRTRQYSMVSGKRQSSRACSRAHVIQCPLLGVKRTFLQLAAMSAFEPKRTSAPRDCCRAQLDP